jgi:hypothetical protein
MDIRFILELSYPCLGESKLAKKEKAFNVSVEKKTYLAVGNNLIMHGLDLLSDLCPTFPHKSQ